MPLLIDLSPLRRYPSFRRLYVGQLVSVLGSSLTMIAIPFHLYEKTRSTAAVGLVGVVQLVPLALTGFWGGALADSMNRVRLVMVCETLLAALAALYPFLTTGESPLPIFVFAAVFSALTGIHRPALEALTPRLVAKEDIPRVSALNGFRGTFAHVIGPTIGGLLVARFGVMGAFWIDSASYLFSVACLARVPEPGREGPSSRASLGSIREGFAYAFKRPVLLGSYLVDIAAMMFCYPLALFPALAEEWAGWGGAGGNARGLGWLYSSGALGALLCTLLSRWTLDVRRYGRAIALAALGWCVGIGFAGFAHSLAFAIAGFVLAGYADMVSAMFRNTLWNQTIPDSVRGRLAGIEMLSYMSGPLIGNTWMGFLAASTGTHHAMQIGAGVSAVGILVIVALWTPALWRFRSEIAPDAPAPVDPARAPKTDGPGLPAP
jgi:MFS family permease